MIRQNMRRRAAKCRHCPLAECYSNVAAFFCSTFANVSRAKMQKKYTTLPGRGLQVAIEENRFSTGMVTPNLQEVVRSPAVIWQRCRRGEYHDQLQQCQGAYQLLPLRNNERCDGKQAVQTLIPRKNTAKVRCLMTQQATQQARR